MTRAIKAYTNKTRRSPRHAFFFKIDGQAPAKVWTTVKPAKSPVTFSLELADVDRAIALKGFGNAQECAGAVCTKRHSAAFPHAFTGHVDWVYNRVYVSCKNDNLNFPKTVVGYDHRDDVAKLFDTPAGLKKLRASIQKNGPRQIKLFPIVYKTREPGRAKGRQDAPPRRKVGALGHKLRMTIVRASMPDLAAS